MEAHCRAKECRRAISPRMLMCRRHWGMVPREMQREVWRHYRRGQEVDGRPTRAYLRAAVAAIDEVARQEGK